MKREPPALARIVLGWLTPPHRLEEAEGDLAELFKLRAAERGIRHARVRYWIDVVSVVRQLRTNHGAALAAKRSPTVVLPIAVNELRYAARALAKRPSYTVVAAFTLALGIGSTVAIFTVLNSVLLQPLPYPASDRIVEILHRAPGLKMPEVRSSPGLTARYRQHTRSFVQVAAYEMRQLNLTGHGNAERVRVIAATPNLLDVLATQPALGRPFQSQDTELNHAPVAILTYGIWQSRFGADPAAIGQRIELDGQIAEIVGVMPRGFAFPDTDTRVLVPMRLPADAPFGVFGTTTLARLAPTATPDSARREVMQLQAQLPEWFPGLTQDMLVGFGWSSDVIPLRDRVVANVSTTIWIVFGTVAIVLLVAAANVANLFLIRAESRQREVAVKAALGASRARIGATFLAESLVLAVLGGAVGLLLADAGTRLLVWYGPPRLPRLQEVRLDSTVVAFTVLLTGVAAGALAILPTLQIARRSFTALLRDGGRGNTAGRARHRVRHALIVAQIAMALVLLVSAGLMLKSIVRLSAVDPGFDSDGLLTVSMSMGARPDRAAALAAYDRMLHELETVPGVARAGAASMLPVGATSMSGTSLSIRSRPRPDSEQLFTMYAGVTSDYFETLSTPFLAGRAPTREDTDQNRPVAWVNNAFARQFLDDRAVGEFIKFRDNWLEIVGVVGDVKTSGLRDETRPMVYLPIGNELVKLDALFAVVRTTGASTSIAASLRSAIERVEPSAPLTVRPMQDIVSASLAQTTFTVTLLAIAATIGLVLGLVGLYGAIGYIAAQRTAEIGVRLALGARPARVCAMVLAQGALVALVGIVVGLAGAWSSARLMSSMLFEVSPHDPATFAGVSVLLLAVSVLATYVPARRAARIDPVQALRMDY